MTRITKTFEYKGQMINYFNKINQTYYKTGFKGDFGCYFDCQTKKWTLYYEK